MRAKKIQRRLKSYVLFKDSEVMKQRLRKMTGKSLSTDEMEDVLECGDCGFEYENQERNRCPKCNGFIKHEFSREKHLT